MPLAPRQSSYEPGVDNSTARYEDFLAEEILDDTAPGTDLVDKKIFAFGVARNRLLQAIKNMALPAVVVKDLDEADIFLTQKQYYRDRLETIVQAEERGLPIFVIKSNSIGQVEQFLADYFQQRPKQVRLSLLEEAADQADEAVLMVKNGERFVNLPPMPAPARRQQHDIAKNAHLVSRSFGKDPNRYVRIYKD